MASDFEKWTKKADELLVNSNGQSMDAKAYRGIAYALLAIAAALNALGTILYNKRD